MALVLQCLPPVVVGPWAGVLVDRFDRRRLLVLTDVARALVVPFFLVAIQLRSLPLVFAIALVHFSVSSAFEPARSALLPSLVRPEDLVAAATLGNLTWSVTIALGGVLGGALVSGVLRGMGGSANWTYSGVILQKTVPDELRGRLFSLDMGAAQLMATLMVLTSGALVDGVGPRASVLTSAGLTLLPLGAWALALPWMERHDAAEAR